MPTDESQKPITITYKIYKDDVFVTAEQICLAPGVSPKDWIATGNEIYNRWYNKGLVKEQTKLELFAETGV